MSDGPVVIVTGAARGIGAAVVRRLAADGWAVIAVDRCADDPSVPYPLGTEAELREICESLPAAVPVVGDVRDSDPLSEAVELAESRFGGLDAAVGAAAVMLGGDPLWETSESTWATLFDVDVGGLFNLARAAVPAMLARPRPRRGRFVALASAAAHRGMWRLGAYCAAKHAVVGLVEGLAADLRGTGVNALAVSPGSTRTAMLRATARLYDLDGPDELAGHQLIDRLLEPEEVASCVAWACSSDGMAVNGSTLHADGGFVG